MILNSFAILDVFVTLIRLGLACVILWLAIPTLRQWNLSGKRGDILQKEDLENRSYLVSLLAFLFLFANLVSWPLLYLLLQSYVSQWPGVMCIYGVTRIGTGSQTISRFLPPLLSGLQLLKPVLVFQGGVWASLYIANRTAKSSPLMPRMLVCLVTLGVLGVLDSLAEAAYLFIPKMEDIPEVGCCTVSADDENRFLPTAFFEKQARYWLTPGFYGMGGGMALGLFWYLQTSNSKKGSPETGSSLPGRPAILGFLFLGSLLSVFCGWMYLIDVAAPNWLHLPDHHCPYDLIPGTPEVVLGVAAFVMGTFSVGWAFLVAILANNPETRETIPPLIQRILTLGFFSYLGAMVMATMESLVNQQ